MLFLLGLPVSLQQRVSWHQRQQTDVCVHVCDTKMPVQAHFIPRKRLLHSTGKVIETLSNYLPCLRQSCKFNPPRASNFPPEDASISHSHGCAVVLLERLLPWHLTHPSAQWPSAPDPRWQPLILSKLCEKAFLYYFSFWCFVKIRLMQSINLGRIKP